MSSCQCMGVRTTFDEAVARKELRRYRNKGPTKSSRILIDALAAEGVRDATLLDIGAGVGAITHGLLEAGVARGTVVDASPAYLEAARSEAGRRGHFDQLSFQAGDFVEVAPEVAPADIVTLDRVICCYDDMESLVTASAERAARLYGLVYPRDTWWARLGVLAVNLIFRVRRNPFRVFIHATVAVDAVIRRSGLELRFRRSLAFWQIAVYGRPG